jgi:hypothetical protein
MDVSTKAKPTDGATPRLRQTATYLSLDKVVVILDIREVLRIEVLGRDIDTVEWAVCDRETVDLWLVRAYDGGR